MKKNGLITLITLLITCFTLSGCDKKHDPNTVVVGTIAGPETELMEAARTVMKEKYHLNLKIVPFTDYNMPNLALNDGSLDANVFQHQPFLASQIKSHGYKISSIGRTFIYPMALYSKKIRDITNIPEKAKVAIPSDPSNEARALLLLQKAQLITLKAGSDVKATPLDIENNPKNLQFVELNAAQLTRSLNDVTLAAINTNYALTGGLSPKRDGLVLEDRGSPYANLIVVKSNEKDKKQLQDLVKSLQSPMVANKAKELFGDDALPAY